jgi:glycine dehydrogenase subunit 1
MENAHSLTTRIASVKGFRAPHFKSSHFNEFVVTSDADPVKIHRGLLARGVHGGHILGAAFSELKNATLYATTEMHTKADHDKLIAALEAV